MTPYKFLVGFVLTVAMVIVLALSALAFSARDFQYGIAHPPGADGQSAHNGVISFARMDEIDAEIAALNQQTLEPRGERTQVRAEREAAEARATTARTQASEISASVVRAAAEIETRATIANQVAETDSAGLARRLGAITGPNVTPADQQALVGLNAQVEQLGRLEAVIRDADAASTNMITREQALDAALADPDNRILALQLRVVPDASEYDRIRSEVAALRNISPLGVTENLAQGHPALLSTVLVLLMGALGSLLYLFPAYLNRPVPVTMAEIVVRLIFGMCAALAVYVLANAAVAGFSMADGVEGASSSASLNPFAVSLVGIVAGVMSEEIARWIQNQSRGIFQQGGPAPRSEPPAEEAMVNPHAIT